MPDSMTGPPLAAQRVVAARTRAAVMAAITANGDVADGPMLAKLQDADGAMANGRIAEATARLSEVLLEIQLRLNAASTNEPPPSRIDDCPCAFTGLTRSCAACGAATPQTRMWLACSGCQRVRYCSDECRSDAWERGHAVSCASGRAPPTPASVLASTAEEAAHCLLEYGRANAELAALCVRRVLGELEAHFEAYGRPSAECLHIRAAQSARRVGGISPDAILPDHAALECERHLRRTIMAWGAGAAGAAGDEKGGSRCGIAGNAEPQAARRLPTSSVYLSTNELCAQGACAAMRAHLADRHVQRLGCRHLALAARFGARPTVLDGAGLAAIIRALAAHPLTAHYDALRAVRAVAMGEGQRLASALLAPVQLPPSVLQRIGPDQPPVAPTHGPAGASGRAAPPVELLSQGLSAGHTDTVRATVYAMRTHPSHVTTQRAAIAILHRIAVVCGAAGVAAVRHADGLAVSVAAMTRHGGDLELACDASALLQRIAASAELPGRRSGAAELSLHDGAVAALVGAMNRHPTSAQLQRRATTALVTTAAISERARRVVTGHPGARAAILAAMRRCPELQVQLGRIVDASANLVAIDAAEAATAAADIAAADADADATDDAAASPRAIAAMATLRASPCASPRASPRVVPRASPRVVPRASPRAAAVAAVAATTSVAPPRAATADAMGRRALGALLCAPPPSHDELGRELAPPPPTARPVTAAADGAAGSASARHGRTHGGGSLIAPPPPSRPATSARAVRRAPAKWAGGGGARALEVQRRAIDYSRGLEVTLETAALKAAQTAHELSLAPAARPKSISPRLISPPQLPLPFDDDCFAPAPSAPRAPLFSLPPPPLPPPHSARARLDRATWLGNAVGERRATPRAGITVAGVADGAPPVARSAAASAYMRWRPRALLVQPPLPPDARPSTALPPHIPAVIGAAAARADEAAAGGGSPRHATKGATLGGLDGTRRALGFAAASSPPRTPRGQTAVGPWERVFEDWGAVGACTTVHADTDLAESMAHGTRTGHGPHGFE